MGISAVITDIELVNQCLSGQELGIEEFVNRFRGVLYVLCYRMMGHREDAEDVAQDSLVRAIRSLHQWDQSRPLRPWLLTIAANRCRTALSKRKKRSEVTGHTIEKVDHDQTAKTNELSEELELAIQQLKPEYQTCFVLFYQQELGCAEVAQILERPVGTIKTWLHRARTELVQILKQRNITPHS